MDKNKKRWHAGTSMAEELTFRASTRFAHALCIFGVAATVTSGWAFSRHIAGWGWLFASALFTVLVIPTLLRLRSLYLHLDHDALETGSRHMDTVRVPWREVDNIELVEMGEGPAKGREAIRIIYSTPARNELVIEDEFNAPLQDILRALNSHLETR
jgi:hypothetical protein